MKVLVTGAAGFVGRAVLKELQSAGHTARAVVRDPSSRQAQALKEEFQIDLAPGNISNPATLRPAATGVDAVIHLVGIISEFGTQTFERIHVHGTKNMLQAAGEAGVNRFVHMSALGTRPNAISRYHQTKWAAEEAVRSSGLEYTIFRPSIIYGPHDQFVNLFARMSRYSPVLPVMGKGQNLMQPIAVEAVALAFVRALQTPGSIGSEFDLCGRERFTFEAILDQILNSTKRHRVKLKIPLPLARMQAVLLEFFFPLLLRRAPPLNRDQLLMLQEDNIGDPSPAQQLFDLELIPFNEGIARYLRPQPTPG